MRHEPILLRAKRYNLLPYRFLHRGVERRVRRVERSWDVGGGWQRRPGHYFRVQCQDGSTCDLFHDVTLNAWYVTHDSLALARMGRGMAFGKGKLRWNFT